MRTRMYCKCGAMSMRTIGSARFDAPCLACGGEMKPTDRLPGGQCTGRSASVYVRVKPDVRLKVLDVARKLKAKIGRSTGVSTVISMILEKWIADGNTEKDLL